ncbi:MAG: MATE family efflux transporter [Sulfolobales archaeon]|nr:MATE family efflux transporter [Sulfolobales archaeon]
MLVGSIPDSVISLVSMVVASRIGTEVVAGTGLASYLFFILNAVMSIFMVGLLVYCSQAFGAGRRDLIERAVGESLLTSITISAAVIISSNIWIHSYTEVLSGGQSGVSTIASTYLSFRILSVPALMVSSILASSYRAVNMPWIPAYSSIATGISSVVLIPSLGLGYLYLPRMGVEGLGIASALSQYVGLALYALFKPPFKLRIKLFSSVLLKVLAIGIPASIERIVGSLGQNIYINAVARSGVRALAAHNIGLSIESILINPVFAVNIAASARVGQRVGSNEVEKLDQLVREALKIGLSWMAIATALLIAVSPIAGGFFTQDVDIAGLVTVYLVLAAISEIGFGGSLALYGVIRGMGSTWVPLVVNSFTVLVLRAALAQLLQPLYGIYGVWFTQITDMYGRLAISYVLYERFKSKLLVKLVS